ncbi:MULTISPECIES: hypothetical protein [Devosia]|uniref:Uncharacterized protein n=1 Tax=Devosia equisanguinis TaxID=2490941 RepID=A0A447IAZ4_9HYPH|nr:MULTISPECIES: hypothetical protein [Devosia]ODT49809.1 MAG: hypothetical protein ABS74_06335 [Pelagibacterium sp. SCN 63-126]ODU86240.1 MAG: hypothetical protein ABT14_09495 [Pelagibacterium sp. SCN 63-17]OJX45184.1 MAG: hypothetical protein BGO80_04985 [Devosia sp. 63-57]VDS04584.1 hypothetical protein DEVEQU_01723 [Devosia equisanguinis]
MTDRFASHAATIDGPAQHGFAISPHDSTELSEATRALYVGAGGTLAVVTVSGASLAFANVSAGSILPLRVVAVKATGTTAADIVGLV